IFSQIWADTSVDGTAWGTDVLVRDLPGGVAPTINLMADGERAHLVFDVSTRGREVERVLHAAVTADGGWQPPLENLQAVSPEQGNFRSPHLTRDANGTLYLVYEEGARRVHLTRSKDGGATWTPAIVVHERDPNGPVGTVKLPQVAASDGVA